GDNNPVRNVKRLQRHAVDPRVRRSHAKARRPSRHAYEESANMVFALESWCSHFPQTIDT
ncbi:hypothetical protein LBW59_11810, partial [Ralstonia solanacearum]